jgi:hypothetical protein
VAARRTAGEGHREDLMVVGKKGRDKKIIIEILKEGHYGHFIHFVHLKKLFCQTGH